MKIYEEVGVKLEEAVCVCHDVLAKRRISMKKIVFWDLVPSSCG
jgi:hypothetical protein